MRKIVIRHTVFTNPIFIYLIIKSGLNISELTATAMSPIGSIPGLLIKQPGNITMPELPGIGFEGKSDLYQEMRALAS